MSDLVSTARSARASLAQALAALQSPGVPSALLEVAEPIAAAMGALHEIETSQGAANSAAAPRALAEVRRALSALQADTTGHFAIQQAMEAVAGSLGLVHSLSSVAQAASAPAARAEAAPARMAGPAPANAARDPRPPSREPIPSDALPRVEAALGVYSPTNFYRGLAGNDVVESGGIFVATYKVPEIGSSLLIHVTLPGGYEFDARGVVHWTREVPATGSIASEAPPGFGARFTEISQEARRLVSRYVQNREPLFHDDP